MADADPLSDNSQLSQATTSSAIPSGRMALLFTVMLVTAAGNTAMQSVMPSIGTALEVSDVWISLAYSWSALLWVVCAPIWARRSDRRGRKAMMALGLIGFVILPIVGNAAEHATALVRGALRKMCGENHSLTRPSLSLHFCVSILGPAGYVV